MLDIAADSLVEYYEREGFDLDSYKSHPSLPVRPDDTVYECCHIGTSQENAPKPGKTYDLPRGRLMTVPVEVAGDRDGYTAVSSRKEYDRCTTFTTEHGLDASDDSDVFGAFVCPECENALG